MDVIHTAADLRRRLKSEPSVALVPTRYCATVDGASDAELLARTTQWEELAPDQYAGRGQRVLATSADDLGLLELRELEIDSV